MGKVFGDDVVYTGKTVFKDGKQWNVVTGGTCCIEELNKGIRMFYDALKEDEVARYAAEICIVTFDSKAQCILDFGNIDRQGDVPTLKADGDTYMGEGVNLALDLLEERKNEYKDAGVDYFQPWLVLMTDGEPNGSSTEFNRAVKRTADAVNNGKLTVFPIAIGAEASKASLEQFSPRRKPISLKNLRFREFFEWLSASVERTSKSVPGEKITLDKESIIGDGGWGEL